MCITWSRYWIISTVSRAPQARAILRRRRKNFEILDVIITHSNRDIELQLIYHGGAQTLKRQCFGCGLLQSNLSQAGEDLIVLGLTQKVKFLSLGCSWRWRSGLGLGLEPCTTLCRRSRHRFASVDTLKRHRISEPHLQRVVAQREPSTSELSHTLHVS